MESKTSDFWASIIIILLVIGAVRSDMTINNEGSVTITQKTTPSHIEAFGVVKKVDKEISSELGLVIRKGEYIEIAMGTGESKRLEYFKNNIYTYSDEEVTATARLHKDKLIVSMIGGGVPTPVEMTIHLK